MFSQRDDVGILNVSAVFAQMNRDLPRASPHRVVRALDEVRIGRLPELAKGRDVINIDPKPHARVRSSVAEMS